MKPGDVLIVDFPFTNLQQTKVRPVVVVTTTDDRYGDVVVALISTSIPDRLSTREVPLQPTQLNRLRAPSVVKTYRLATIDSSRILAAAGRLSDEEFGAFVEAFQSLLKPE